MIRKKWCSIWLVLILCLTTPVLAWATEAETVNGVGPGEAIEVAAQTDLGITSRAAILMEVSTGTVIYEKNADEALSPASITKIMTLILIFDALAEGKIQLDEEVTTSAYAKSMGGSQVFLEEGERQTVETLIKCIVVASGNDASVAIAEHLAGSETEFVVKMNERAAQLGMTQTNFEDCCGLTNSTTHVTSARDVAIMSRELITKYPQIHNYSTIWMENITHVTTKGRSEFCLVNTNKLLKQYEWCTGLKTGSTSLAKYCVSATAKKDGVDLIAVIMAAPDYKVRFSEAMTLLNFGYANCRLYRDEEPGLLPTLKVKDGVKEEIRCHYDGTFSYLCMNGEDVSRIQKEWIYSENLMAPISKGEKIGMLRYLLDGKCIGEIPIISVENLEKAGYADYFRKVFDIFLIK